MSEIHNNILLNTHLSQTQHDGQQFHVSNIASRKPVINIDGEQICCTDTIVECIPPQYIHADMNNLLHNSSFARIRSQVAQSWGTVDENIDGIDIQGMKNSEDWASHHRVDLSHLTSYAIDNNTQHIAEDAFSIDANYIYIHFTDITRYMKHERFNKHISHMMETTGGNLYMPGHAQFALPHQLLSSLLSFGAPNWDGSAFTIRIHIADMREQQWKYGRIFLSMINPNRLVRLDYSTADLVLGLDIPPKCEQAQYVEDLRLVLAAVQKLEFRPLLLELENESVSDIHKHMGFAMNVDRPTVVRFVDPNRGDNLDIQLGKLYNVTDTHRHPNQQNNNLQLRGALHIRDSISSHMVTQLAVMSNLIAGEKCKHYHLYQQHTSNGIAHVNQEEPPCQPLYCRGGTKHQTSPTDHITFRSPYVRITSPARRSIDAWNTIAIASLPMLAGPQPVGFNNNGTTRYATQEDTFDMEHPRVSLHHALSTRPYHLRHHRQHEVPLHTVRLHEYMTPHLQGHQQDHVRNIIATSKLPRDTMNAIQKILNNLRDQQWHEAQLSRTDVLQVMIIDTHGITVQKEFAEMIETCIAARYGAPQGGLRPPLLMAHATTQRWWYRLVYVFESHSFVRVCCNIRHVTFTQRFGMECFNNDSRLYHVITTTSNGNLE